MKFLCVIVVVRVTQSKVCQCKTVLGDSVTSVTVDNLQIKYVRFQAI